MQTGKVPVLHLTMSLGIGGVETHVIGLANSLSERTWPVYVGSHGGERVQELEVSGARHLLIPLHSRRPFLMAKAYALVSQAVDTFGIGLIHAHARIPAWIASSICRKKGIPLVTTYHGAFAAGFPWNMVTRSGDLTIAVSQDIKDYVIDSFSFSPDKVLIIPNGIDTTLYHPPSEEETGRARKQLGLKHAQGPIIAYVSRLDRELSETAVAVADAVRNVREKFPRALLLIAGDGDNLEKVRTRAAEINAWAGMEAVRCLGFVVDTPALYAASDLVIGMSRVALEAMATARPTIIAGAGGIFGAVREEILYFLEERNLTSRNAPIPCDPAVLTREIEDLLSDPARMQELGLFGREVVLRRHSVARVTGEHENIYRSLLMK